MNIWVTGGAGLVGKGLSVLLKKKNIKFIATTRQQVDICDENSICDFLRKNSFTHIINCAAFTAVDDAEVQKELAFAVNAKAPGILAKYAKENNCKFLHISTDYVFSGKERIPLKEDEPTEPVNYYGITKLEGEKRVLEQYPSSCVLRTSWVFGSGGKNFISSLINLLQSKEEIKVANDQIGRPTYCHDLLEAIWDLKDASGIYHFASSGQASRYEVACSVLAYINKNQMNVRCKHIIPVTHKEFTTLAQRPLFSVLDTSKYEEEYRKHPRNWIDTLEEFFHEIKN